MATYVVQVVSVVWAVGMFLTGMFFILRPVFGVLGGMGAAASFDERFRRLWRVYLAYCEAGVRVGDIDVVQYELAHATA